MEYSSSGSRACEQIPLCRRLSQFFRMNWTEGTFYRHSRGKLRKANTDKQRQKEYFAKAKIRAAEQREALKNGPPPISYLQSNSALPEPHPDTNVPERKSSYGTSHERGGWGASVPTAEDSAKSKYLLPTVDQFLKEQAGKATAIDTAPSRSKINAKEVERLRQRLLASKDWGAGRSRPPVQVNELPRVVPEQASLTQPTRATKEKPAHILQSNRGMYPQKHTSRVRSLRRMDVQVRVGSQEKQLKESSTIGSGSFGRARQDAPTGKSRDFMRSSSDRETRDTPPRKRARRQPSSSAEDYPLRQATSRHTDSDDTHHIVTSVPSILHPVPLRAIPGHLLLSSGTLDSAKIASHVVQVGGTISPVPPSQKTENSIWRSWLEESSCAPGAPTDSEPHELVARSQISPGVSERHEVRYEVYSPPAQPLRARESGITLPRTQICSADAHSDVLGQYVRPVDNTGHPTPSPNQRRLSVLLETSSNDFENTVNDRYRRVPAISNQPVSTSAKLARGLHQDDPTDAWKTFVFGDDDSEEVERVAFSEARHDAAQKLRPYDENSLPSIGEDDHSGHDSNIAVAGTSSSANGELPQPYERHFVIEPSIRSPRKISGPSSTSSEPNAASAEEHVVIPHYTPAANSQSSVAVEPLGVYTGSISNDKPETTKNMTIAVSDAFAKSTSVAASVSTSTEASLVVEPAQSQFGAPEPGEQFRFAPPKPFVGKHSVPSHNDRPSAAIAPVIFKRKRGRPRKRARDGRADIRALPNYSGDPIEEIEEDDDAPPPSLFGSLDVCYDQY